jgi:hypothetical protein
MEKIKREMVKEAQVIFHNPFTFCSLRKLKLVFCPFVEEETDGNYLHGNELNRLNRS